MIDLEKEIRAVNKVYAAIHGIPMNMPDGNTAALSRHETAQQILDRSPAHIPDFSDPDECKHLVGKDLAKQLADVFATRDELLAYGEKRKSEDTVELLKKLRALELAMYVAYDQ